MALLLTPLGILAERGGVGRVGGEGFFRRGGASPDCGGERQRAPPASVPSGLARWAKLWTAPLPDYAPHFVKSAAFGYLLSAMFGVGLILAATWLMQRLTAKRITHAQDERLSRRREHERGSVIGKTVRGFTEALAQTLEAEDSRPPARPAAGAGPAGESWWDCWRWWLRRRSRESLR